MDKFLDRYRIGSARLQKWDYRWKGAYFITILCKNREHYFGEILDEKMKLSGIGIIADILWYEIKNHAQKRFQNQGKNSVSSIIGSYKSAISKHAHRLGFDFEWQERFYDNVIRGEKSFQTISEYIVNNPEKWKDDRFYNADSD